METVPNSFPDLFIGYSVIFGILMAYVFLLTRRTSALEKKISELEKVKESKSNAS